MAATLDDQTLRPLISALKQNFSHDQEEVATLKLHGRKQKPSETFEKLSFEIKKLTRKAYSGADEQTRNRLAKDAYLNAVGDDTVRRKLRDKNPRTLEEAVQESHRFAANKELEKDSSKSSRSDKSEKSEVKKLREQIRQLKIGSESETLPPKTPSPRTQPREEGQWKRRSSFGPPVCWRCSKKGHISRWCPFTDAQMEQMRRNGELPASTPGNGQRQKPLARESLS